MNKMFRGACCVLLILLACIPALSAQDDLVTRYLTAANDQYTAGNYPKAFSYINVVLNSYKEEALPENVGVIAETIYYAYLTQVKDSRDSAAFAAIKEKLVEFPAVSSDRISRTVKIISTYAAQDASWGSEPASPAGASGAASGYSSSRSSKELDLALETVRKETADQTRSVDESHRQELLSTQKDAYERALEQAKEATGTNNRVLLFALLILAGICFVVFIVVILNLLVNLKNAKSQDERFVETLKAVSTMARLPQSGPPLTALPPTYGADTEMRMIGSSVASTGLPPPPVSEDEKVALDALARKCREIGLQIDQVTGRKNNSKNVAEMVFKIVQEMGVGQYESMVLFSVAMVYDIGFLEIDASLLQAENLTDAQKYEIRNHVKQGLAQLSFVPEKYMGVFADGVLMHHENMDGSGYPEGLAGERIPLIARLIHVAESFVALVSRRSYRDIYDKESAVAELRKKPGLYDPSVIDILERII